MLKFFNRNIFLLVFISLSLKGFSEFLKNCNVSDSTTLNRGDEFYIPVSALISGGGCTSFWFYFLNLPLYFAISIFLSYLISKELEQEKKLPLAAKIEQDNAVRRIVRISMVIRVAAAVIFAIQYITGWYQYLIFVVIGYMAAPIVATLYIQIPRRNIPGHQIYYFFHPTPFVKVGWLLGFLFMVAFYLFIITRPGYR